MDGLFLWMDTGAEYLNGLLILLLVMDFVMFKLDAEKLKNFWKISSQKNLKQSRTAILCCICIIIVSNLKYILLNTDKFLPNTI